MLMINNKIFYGPQGKNADGKSRVLATREGTDEDERRVDQLFQQMHFTVDTRKELSASVCLMLSIILLDRD